MSGIIRIEKNTNYTHISNIPANDKGLSWEARGVLFYLLTKPNGWKCYNQDLINKGPAGGDKIERILDELQEHGYVTRQRTQKEDGTFDWETTIHEMPVEPEQAVIDRIAKKRLTAIEKRQRRKEKATIGVLSTDGSPTSGSPTNGKHPDIVITESTTNKEEKEAPDYLEHVLSLQGKVSESTAPNPNDQWFEYTDKAIKKVKDSLGYYPNQVEKEAIVKLAGEPSFDPVLWIQAIEDTVLNWSGRGRIPLARVIEVYHAGGYAEWKRLTYGDNKSNDKLPTPGAFKADDEIGGWYA